MTKENNNFFKDNYKYLGSGSSKDVFKRKRGFKPSSLKRGDKKFSEKKDYVSAFFYHRQHHEYEVKALKSIKLVDPLEIFTIQMVESRDLYTEPKRYALQKHLMRQVPEEWKREFSYILEIIFPFGGIRYETELKSRKYCSLRDFLFPILLFIFCVGYMNDSGYFHLDIKDANVLFSDSQLYLIDFSLLTKDFRKNYERFIFYNNAEKCIDNGLHLDIFWPPERNYLNMLQDADFSKDLKRQAKKYNDIDLTLKDWLKYANKYVPEIVKENIFYLKQLKSLNRFSPERYRLDLEYKEILVKRMIQKNEIYLKCYEKHNDSKGEVINNEAGRKCLEPAINNLQDIFLLYADRYDSFQLGSTILIWISTFRENFYHALDKKDKHTFDSFSLSVYEHLCAFNVIFRMSLSSFHKHFLKQLRFFGSKDFLQEYKEYCSKIYNKERRTAESDSDKVKESVESESQYFEKNLFSFLDSLIE